MEHITDAGYTHSQRVCNSFKIKNLGEYHDLYVQSHALLLADAFEYFRNMFLEIFELNPDRVLSALRLAWQVALKQTETKLEILTDIDILLILENGIGGGIFHVIHRYVKANNKYMKDYDKNKELSYLQYW